VALELIAVEAAARRQEPGAMEQLERSLEIGRAAAEAGNQEALAELNAAFHDTLSAGAGSAYLAGLLHSVRNQAHHLVGGWHTAPDISWSEHEPILAAVLDSDADRAVALMRQHLMQRHEIAAQSASIVHSAACSRRMQSLAEVESVSASEGD
jgi:DNA-binding GntR family transcriptional regulator